MALTLNSLAALTPGTLSASSLRRAISLPTMPLGWPSPLPQLLSDPPPDPVGQKALVMSGDFGSNVPLLPAADLTWFDL